MRVFFAALALLLVILPFSFAQECDYGIELLINGTEFSQEDFKWRMMAVKIGGVSTNITGTARIEDLKGNIVKSYKPWTFQSISRQKTSNEYTPNLKEGDYKIIAEIVVLCEDIDKSSNIDAKLIRIVQENDKNAAFTSQSVSNQQKSGQNTETADEKEDGPNELQTSKIPAENACNCTRDNDEELETFSNVVSLNKNADGKYENMVKGDVVDIKNDKEFEYVSSNEKAKSLIVYMLLGVSIVLNLVLIWRR